MEGFDNVENYIWDFISREGESDRTQLINCCIAVTFLKDLSYTQNNSDFIVPEAARWDYILKTRSDTGIVLHNAFQALGEANRGTKEVFFSFFEDFNVLRKNKKLESTVFGLIREMASVPHFNNKTFDLLTTRVVGDTKIGFGLYVAPLKLTELMVALLDVQDKMAVCDPICRTGELLVQCEKHSKSTNNIPGLKLYGQEANKDLWKIAKLNLILHGHPAAPVPLGDVIKSPLLLDEQNELCTFDRVISILPFGRHEWGTKTSEDDPYGRFRYGVPPRMTGEFAYIQHMIATLKSSGKLVTAVTPGLFFRRGAEEKIRKNIINSDLIEAIIQLPPKIFSHTSTPICLIIMNMNKPVERSDSILFISVEDEDTLKISDAYRKFENIDGYCRAVNVSEIVENNYNLSVSLYVNTVQDVESVDINNSIKDIQALREHRELLLAEMQESLNKLGLIR